jgi:signal transduction histidine kinase
MDSQADPIGLLQQVSNIAMTSSSPALLIARLAKAIGEAFQADGCIVTFSKSLTEDAEISCWLAHPDNQPIWQLLALQDYVMQPDGSASEMSDQEDATSTGVGGVVKNVADSIWQHVAFPATLPPTATVLELPTQFQGWPNGVISLMRSHLHLWTNTEMAKLEILGPQIAATFAQMQLQHHVHKQFQYQDVVNQLTLATRNASDLTEVLRLAIDGTAQALQVQNGLLLRFKYTDPLFRSHSLDEIPKARVTVASEWSDATRPLHTESTTLEPFPNRLHQSFWLSDCELCQHAFKSAYPIVMRDRQGWDRYNIPTQPSECVHFINLNSFMIARLESQGTVLGLLVFQDSRPRSWEQSEVELVDLVSAQVSNAIIQTETLRQVQSLVEKRTAELQQSLTIQAKLYERTRQQVEQLRQLNQLKDEFLDTVSHELRTPLTSMALAIRMLRQVGSSSDRSQRYLDILEQQCAQETNLVNDLLALRELESKQVAMQLEDINLVELIEELAASFRPRWAVEGLSLELDFPDQPVRLRSDRDSLSRVISELLTNAGKYSAAQQCVQMKLIYRQEVPTNQIILSLCNTGAGISPEELPYIFDKFRRCQGATQNAIQGTGLGLALVKSLVQHLNGTISVSSTPVENSPDWETCFSLILPQSFDLVQSK